MPYHVGEKGSYGCSGYPVIKDGTSEVMGCHDSVLSAQNQITAINMSEAEKGKKKLGSGAGEFDAASDKESMLFPKRYSISENAPGCSGFAVIDDDGEIEGCFETREAAEAYLEAEQREDEDDDDDDMLDKSDPLPTLTDEQLDAIDKAAPCWEGYVQRGMKEKDGRMVPNCVPATKSLFADFGKDYTNTDRLTHIFND